MPEPEALARIDIDRQLVLVLFIIGQHEITAETNLTRTDALRQTVLRMAFSGELSP